MRSNYIDPTMLKILKILSFLLASFAIELLILTLGNLLNSSIKDGAEEANRLLTFPNFISAYLVIEGILRIFLITPFQVILYLIFNYKFNFFTHPLKLMVFLNVSYNFISFIPFSFFSPYSRHFFLSFEKSMIYFIFSFISTILLTRISYYRKS